MRHTRHSSVRQGSFLRHYLKKSALAEKIATSPTPSNADPPGTLPPQEVRRRYVNLLISRKKYDVSSRPWFCLLATLHFRLLRGARVSLSTEVRSSRTVIGEYSQPFTLRLGSDPPTIFLSFERTSPHSLDYMRAVLSGTESPPESRSFAPNLSSAGSSDNLKQPPSSPST